MLRGRLPRLPAVRARLPPDLSPSERTLPALLDRQADVSGDAVLVRTEVGERSFREQRDLAASWAGRLAAEGLAAGDAIAIMSENRAEVLDLWLGAAWLGAVAVPVNTAARGSQLAHVLRDSGARIFVVAAEAVGALEHVDDDLPSLERIWVLDDGRDEWRGRPLETIPGPADPLARRAVRPGDTTAILYTSGTTGPPKGVLCPQAQWYWWGVRTGALLGVGPDDVLYTCLPLFHTNALNTFVQALLAGATFMPGPRFSASAFWRRLAESEATVTYLLGAMAHILAKRPPDPYERRHRTRIALAPGTAADLYPVFRERFGIEIVDGWGSTETNVVIATAGTDAPPGSMGVVVDGFEARVVDEEDEEVGPNTPGELVVRAREPFSFANGYHRLPADTLRAWRNLWFHTGDRVVRDDDGWFWFLDRMKDSIRRRGENISSYEVEAALTSHPDVAAAAAVPVPAEVGEDDVLAFVVLRQGARPTHEELIRHCEPRLAYFAVPRYLEFVDELPLTANGKIEKYRLRERGIGTATWDREAAGVELRRQ
jgi:crotonobetaine/carnitine-CoA ligase